MAEKKSQQRLSMDALELLEDIASDGPFESADLLTDLPRDDDDPWTPERFSAALDELIASGRVTRAENGLLRTPDDGFCSALTVTDEELGVRVRVSTSVFTADASLDLGMTASTRAESDTMSELANLVVERLRSVNGLAKKAHANRR